MKDEIKLKDGEADHVISTMAQSRPPHKYMYWKLSNI